MDSPREYHTILTHMWKPLRRTTFNRVFAAVYACGVAALLCYHLKNLLHSTSLVHCFLTLSLFIADLVLAFMWFAVQGFRMRPIRREEFPENLEKIMKRSEYPGLDVFICTADPYKEPPMNVVNTALSVLAYDYPTEKLSIYVSDDGGSALTLFAFMEAAKFASHWLPFCRKNSIVERSPKAYFGSDHVYSSSSSETQKIKAMYESMTERVENVVRMGNVGEEYVTSDKDREAFNKWNDTFTRQNHPTVIQVLLENARDRDITGHFMPNLIYVSREKSKASDHHFKAGALNVLLRVSAAMTNAPIILTLDCDTYSNDPTTPLRMLCYYSDPKIRSSYGFVQFPQRFQGINENDIYAAQIKREFQIQPMGLDGLVGPNHVGTACFFFRRTFFGGPSDFVSPEIQELGPDHIVDGPLQSQEILALAYQVAGCNYENQTDWGYKMGYKYGSVAEDFFTGLLLQYEGWRSIYCNPDRPAFLGDAPISFMEMLIQQRRWCIGLYQVGISKYSPLTFGVRTLGILPALCYSHYAFWAAWTIPITIYAFLPQLALLNNLSIFPKVSERWFLLYAFLFLAAYGQYYYEFVTADGNFQMWWNDQRIWNMRGLTCNLFGSVELFLKSLGFSTFGFDVTSKVVDDEQSKRYEQGIFEFGVHSPMLVPLTMAALINLISFTWGLATVITQAVDLEGLLVQILIAGFATVNSWPIYEAMVLRNDKGKLCLKTTIISAFLTLACLAAASFILK